MVEEVYTQYAGQTYIQGAQRDKYGNPEGTKYDLAKNEAFKGNKIAVLHLYTKENFDFKLPSKALEEKGFKIHSWTKGPDIGEFRSVLDEACQLWLISTSNNQLNNDHLKAIKNFFDSGRGIYIWGDNEPYYAEANYVTQELFGIIMEGNVPGEQIVHPQKGREGSGYKEHLITTGIEHLYEGITIATIQESSTLEPLMYGSAGNLLIAIYDRDGKRAIIDGGFTRLYNKWDTAGTGRYVKNAAAWLVNHERWSNLTQSQPKELNIAIECISPFFQSLGSFSLHNGKTMIYGRDNVPSNIPQSEQISRKHFILTPNIDEGGIIVTDTSTNGLYVNEIKLRKDSPQFFTLPVILDLAGVAKLHIKKV